MAAAPAPAAVGGLEGNKEWMDAEVRRLLYERLALPPGCSTHKPL